MRQQDGSWTRSEKESAEIFATHLSKICKPNSIALEKESKLLSNDITFVILNTLTRPFRKEVRAVIKNLNPKKAPGHDFTTNQILQKLSVVGIKYITQLCNAIFRRGFFPLQRESNINYCDPEA
jgi:hypothetical protein